MLGEKVVEVIVAQLLTYPDSELPFGTERFLMQADQSVNNQQECDVDFGAESERDADANLVWAEGVPVVEVLLAEIQFVS